MIGWHYTVVANWGALGVFGMLRSTDRRVALRCWSAKWSANLQRKVENFKL